LRQLNASRKMRPYVRPSKPPPKQAQQEPKNFALDSLYCKLGMFSSNYSSLEDREKLFAWCRQKGYEHEIIRFAETIGERGRWVTITFRNCQNERELRRSVLRFFNSHRGWLVGSYIWTFEYGWLDRLHGHLVVELLARAPEGIES
jgi:hypothetical protein